MSNQQRHDGLTVRRRDTTQERKPWMIEPDPHSLQHELTLTTRQRLWRECCQSSDDHRFDCRAVPTEKRGDVPFGPVLAPTPAQLVAAMRR